MSGSPEVSTNATGGLDVVWRDDFHVAQLIRSAATAEERARILLQAPDALLFQQTSQILRACFDAHFDLGAHFVEVRVAAMCAKREFAGDLPARTADQVNFYRQLLCQLIGENA